MVGNTTYEVSIASTAVVKVMYGACEGGTKVSEVVSPWLAGC